ncbi:hypothetical protein ABEB36_004910 [Hypothenemus hampei]|uniref:Helicase ATP-binding domain-containing protein n=1 Tax=Hypothenemus hampei TaxID=57062 RepID=A0ABD1EW98_HYPHA
MANTEQTQVPTEFNFPFPPYKIQLEFMQALYRVIEKKQLGIFESPTGTGKSLSLLCASLKWLGDNNAKEKQSISEEITRLNLLKQEYVKEEQRDWFSAQSKEIEVTRKFNELKLEEMKMLNYEMKIDKIRNRQKKHERKGYKNKSNSKESTKNEELCEENSMKVDEEDMLLSEGIDGKEDSSDDEENTDPNNTYQPVQIIIASRTHSQLNQFIGEIKKLRFAETVRVAILASRQNCCINPSVKKLRNINLINEKCLDMQKKNRNQSKLGQQVLKKRKTLEDKNNKCLYYKQTNIEELRDIALNEILDMEDLMEIGKDLKACPYYANRKTVEDAQIILMPYNTLLHKSTREANGVKLKNNVIIIDEAHNLLEAMAQMHGSELTYPQMFYGLQTLKCYKNRFHTRFSAVTLRLLNQLIFVVNQLNLLFEKDTKENTTSISSLEEFVLASGIDQYNFFNLVKFCKSSQIAQKTRSYGLKYSLIEEIQSKKPQVLKKGINNFLESISKNNKKEIKKTQSSADLPKFPIPNNPLLAVISFLESLTYSYEDGRILLINNVEKEYCKVQFLLLNPTSNFNEVIKEARSVIVAGGTMKPYNEFKHRLFMGAGAASERIVHFSCEHVIPPENILPIVITKGFKNENFLFNFNNRMSMGDCLRDVIHRSCDVVNGGIVVFFPSYNYEKWFYQQVQTMDFGRMLYREPQTSSGGSVDTVLEKYALTIKKCRKALLFSVVGGKLSEGLNFSDDLGRCVIVVGMPYANQNAPDLKEKMLFLDKTIGQGAGHEFYENLCMKAVNQCIGRAVRHKDDYASVLLLDERYEKQHIQDALPNWIKKSLKVAASKEAFHLIHEFFNWKDSH